MFKHFKTFSIVVQTFPDLWQLSHLCLEENKERSDSLRSIVNSTKYPPQSSIQPAFIMKLGELFLIYPISDSASSNLVCLLVSAVQYRLIQAQLAFRGGGSRFPSYHPIQDGFFLLNLCGTCTKICSAESS